MSATSVVAEFAAQQEAAIAERVQAEQLPKARLQTEFMLRQDYALRLAIEQRKMVRSERLTTPEIERLKAEREALFKQLEALELALEKAALEAPEIKELQAVIKTNRERIDALREVLMPDSLRKASEPQENNP